MSHVRSIWILAAYLVLTFAVPAFAQSAGTSLETGTSAGKMTGRANDMVLTAARSDIRSQAQDEERAQGLVRIGEQAIARDNDAALDAYFAEDFVYHGPGGDMNYVQLKANFAAMRAAFSGFAVTRQGIS